MNIKHTFLASAAVGMLFSATAMAASLTDRFDPYVTVDEISATRSMPNPAAERMADFYDPYILSHEIVISEGCANPANQLVANRFDPFVTYAQLETAERNRTC